MWKYIYNYFTKWWYTAIFFIASLFLFIIVLTFIQREPLFDITICLMLLSILFIFISAIVHFFRKKWLTGIIQIVITAFIFTYLSFFLLYLPNDFYANSLELPKNVKLELPIDFENGVQDESTLQKSEPYNLKFVLVNSFQPGIYSYYLWLNPKEKGTVYLKAFEITNNDPLSVQRLKQRSAIIVDSGNLKLYNQEFTIYEGDWDYPYGARIEVWFMPESGSKEYKLLQKNYKIEGWMR